MQVIGGARCASVRLRSEDAVASRAERDGHVKILCVPADRGLDGFQPTLNKMDVEAQGIHAAKRARETTRGGHPLSAVCVQRAPDELRRESNSIGSLSDKYRFVLNAHDEEGRDLMCHTVLSDWLLEDS